MVGSAQYQDQEIEWVLAAIVSKQKQAYIQSHFKRKFGRVLNYNQIRYIKNKYGKDPKFNSPLVNIRAPIRATTPDPDGSTEYEDGGEQESGAGIENQSETEPSMVIDQAQDGRADNRTKATQPKRKRSGNEPRGVQSLIQHIPKTQRLHSSGRPGPTLPGSQREIFSPQQNTSNSFLPASQIHTHAPPMTLASLNRSNHGSPYARSSPYTTSSPCARISRGIQHPQPFSLMQNTSTDNDWVPSTPIGSHGWKSVMNTAVFTGISSSADSSAMAQASPSPIMNQHQPMGYMMFQSPTAAQYQARLPSAQMSARHISQFSPAASLPSYAGHLGQSQQLLQQEQQLHSHTGIGAVSNLHGSRISNLGGETYAHNLSGVAPQRIPSFQEVPIESTFPQHDTKRLNLSGMGHCTNWTHLTPSHNSSPQDNSPFNFTTPSMSFPFESERHTGYTGFTAASSQASSQTLVNNVNNINSANIYNSSFPTQEQQHNHSPQSVQQHLNFDANAFEQLLGIAQPPVLNTTTAMPYAQLSYPMSNPAWALPLSMGQAGHASHLCHSRSTPGSHVQESYGVGDDASGTIDPRLLTTNSASPHASISMSSSSLDEAKHEKQPPAASSST